MRIKFGMRAAVFATAAVLALGACTSPEERASAGTAADGGAAGEAAQTLQLAIQAQPTTFQIGNWSGGEAYLFLSVYDTLLAREVSGEIVPAVAESWEYSEDRKTLTFPIREGMTFTDGTPVDASAVVASLEAARIGPPTSAVLASVSGVEATDESTVVVTLSRPDASLVPALTGVAGAIGAPDVLTAESSKLEPVGSGPYVLDQDATTVGAVYTLAKNPDHWNADGYPFETVEFRVMGDPTAVQNAMQSGQIDHAGVTADQLRLYPEDKFTSGENNPQAVGGVWLADREGTVVPALADVRVRQAINLAIDREGIAESINPGSTTATNQIVSPTGEAFSEELLDTYAYDVEEAKELMADAGYADGFDVTMPSTVLSTSFESILTQELGDIGIRVTWESVPFQEFFAKVASRNYAMYFTYNGFAGSDALDVNAGLTGSFFNPFGSTSSELQALLDTANASAEEEQGEAFGAVNEYLVREAWIAPISYATSNYVTSKDVEFTPPLVSSQTVRPWKPASSS